MFQSSPGRLTGCNLAPQTPTYAATGVSILTRSSDRMQRPRPLPLRLRARGFNPHPVV